MPADHKTLRRDVVEGDAGQHDLVVETKYEAPVTANEAGEVIAVDDPHAGYDLWAARRMHEVLNTAYPGFPWMTVHDSKQGYAGVSIPILMGVNKFMVINLKTHAMTPGEVIKAGGEILERYNLPRHRLEIASFLEARQKHSALVVPSRVVPS